MSEKEAIKLLKYKIINADTDIYIGDLDKTNIEAIKIVLNKYNKQKEVLDKIKQKVNQYELIKGYYDYIEENGYAETTSHDTLKEDILELLEEIE